MDAMDHSKLFSWQSYGISDVGKARTHNEDSLLERPEKGLWVIADGMGGHDAGDVASTMIVNAMDTIDKGHALHDYLDNIEDRLLEVNQKLIQKAKDCGKARATIGSTVVVLLIYNKYFAYIWVGDSRLYRLREGVLHQITVDHSQVEHYIKQGLISRDEALFHPHSNMITRAVGAADDLYLDMDIQEVRSGDRYLLCSDGLTKHVIDYEFQGILGLGTPKNACEELIQLTLDRGAKDNVTVLVVDVE